MLQQLKFEIEYQCENKFLEEFVLTQGIQQNIESQVEFDLKLIAKENGLTLECGAFSKKPLSYFIDIDAFVAKQSTFPAAKQGAFNQALGKQGTTVVDLTAGWGGDALLMCAQGYRVTMVERHPVMALMLKDAMQRLAHTEWAQQHGVLIPQVYNQTAQAFLADFLIDTETEADCLYFDPMFPPKRKKSAAVNKNMQLLHWLVGQDDDASDVLQLGLQSNAKRIAVKRPHYAEVLAVESAVKPGVQFSSKLVHYDVYFKPSR